MGIITYACGQSVILDSVHIDGLQKTREYIVLRELTFHPGDTLELSRVMSLFRENELQLMNTGLFTKAEFNLERLDLVSQTMSIRIHLVEAWYIYPAPILEFLDNDPNKWWYNYKLSLQKVSYGAFVTHTNFTGNGDVFTAYGQAGFTRKISLQYNFPFLNKSKNFGAGFNFFHARNRDLAYNNFQNKLQFYRDEEEDMLVRTKFGINLQYRPRLRWTHFLEINTFAIKVNPLVTSLLNSDFLPRRNQFVLETSIITRYDSRDIKPYPMYGAYFTGWVNRTGHLTQDEIHIFNLGSHLAVYVPITERWSTGNILAGSYNLDRGKTPYFYTKTLGYNDESLRGYENYVMNGQDYFYSRNSVRFLSLDKKINLGRYMMFKAYRELPFRVYLTANFDFGYVKDRYYFENNTFVNRWLTGGGLGLDLVFYYNKLVRLEYSINHTGEKGIYLHFDAGL
ncbi:MAG TPA: hypothetical protein PK076_05505 [Saprospiraceae bacterium]|nr:hypothetical protein [Saprospiraceae bacterium]